MSGPLDTLDTLVIGAGQAGLALGHHLTPTGARFLIVDAAAGIGDSWRRRWDSLRLFTPAQYDNLPGLPFPAARDTYPSKDDITDYLNRYATRFDLPIRLNTPVTKLTRTADGAYLAEAGGELVRAQQVVVATGPFHVPVIPSLAGELDPGVTQLHSKDYRNPETIPAGRVLVVGAGNSGCQIAKELPPPTMWSSPPANRTRSCRSGRWAATCGGGAAVCDWIGSPPSPVSAVDSPAETQSSGRVHGSSPTASGCGSDPG